MLSLQFSAIVYNPSSIPNQVWLRIPLTQQQTLTLDTSTVKKHSINAEEVGVRFPLFVPFNDFC